MASKAEIEKRRQERAANNPVMKAAQGAKNNIEKASAAYTPNVVDSRDASLAGNSDIKNLASKRDKLGVEYANADNKDEIKDTLNNIDGKIKKAVEEKTDYNLPVEARTASEDDYRIGNGTAQEMADLQKSRNSFIDDYFGNSMSDMWKNLSKEDKKILLLDQIGTTLKNASKARLPMYSAYGKNYEGSGFGNEQSMLQKGINESFEKGLERRNSRLDQQMDQLINIANFPANLEMQLRSLWKSGHLNNKLKADLIYAMKDVHFLDALKSHFVQNPTAPIDTILKLIPH